MGIVVQLQGARLMEVSFPGAGVVRTYAQQTAPLRRFALGKGQKARTKQGKIYVVVEVREVKGLFVYLSEEGRKLSETDLDHVVADETPLTRFLMGHWAHPKTFQLRQQAWQLRSESLRPELRGLVGPRLDLLPHQLYIATEVARREFPRVLLADEVGLGKTIEAGLIFSSLRALGRANRVLVLVPEALEHQWLAEMFRRFQEMFSVVDEERSEAEDASQGESAFHMNQRIICSLPFLEQNAERLQQAVEEEWDLLIIDEAHRLRWSQSQPSIQWEMARLLSQRARGLLLLTATPERQGPETQFGLLHLVDPARFPDFQTFQKDNKRMHAVALAAQRIQKGDRDDKFLDKLKEDFGKDKDLQGKVEKFREGGSEEPLLDGLVDRHGTGRVFIRNRRHRLGGFPERKFIPLNMAPPTLWQKWLASIDIDKLDDNALFSLGAGLEDMPSGFPQSVWFGARAQVLKRFLESVQGEKVLLLCSSADRVLELQNWFRKESGFRTAIFHEDMEIVERDRQAAWFAQPDGAKVLFSSEIGGEGRNFQFCRNLFLFDLPLHPDSLEQRIGRLDRIGQTSMIRTFVPFFEGTPEEALVQWYGKGMELFTRPWNGGDLGRDLVKHIRETLLAFLPKSENYSKRRSHLQTLLNLTREKVEEIRARQRESVDLLVDINSFNEKKGKALVKAIQGVDKSPLLQQFLDNVFDYFGVETEKMDEAGTVKVNAHSMTFVESFPGLSSEGEVMATYRRDQALTREELSFLTWEHPIVLGALSLTLEGEVGRVSAGVCANLKSKEPLLMEMLFVLQCTAPPFLEVEHDLPVRVMRVYVTPDGRVVDAPKGFENASLTPLRPEQGSQILADLRGVLPQLMEVATKETVNQSTKLIEAAMELRQDRFAKEHARLTQLAKVNSLISKAELNSLFERCREGLIAIKTTAPRLDAVRLIHFVS